MKLRLIAIMVVLAATTGYSKFGFGIKGGLSLFQSTNNRDLGLYEKILTGPEIAAFIEIEKNKFLSNTISLSYYQAGGKLTTQMTDLLGNKLGSAFLNTLQLDYIGIGYGVNARAKLLSIVPYLSAGLSFDFLLKTREQFISDGLTLETHTLADSNYIKFNIRPHLAAGLEYKISKFSVFAEYNFSYNLIPYYIGPKSGNSDGIRYSTFGHFINIGCKINL